jgi:L-histidine N-alpha-methyltransferase
MLNPVSEDTRFHSAFQTDVIRGLSRARKCIPCRWLYDEKGSDLFEQITQLPEYYPTRVETSLLREHAQDIAGFASRTMALLEYGAGSGVKTEILLAATSPAVYVPIDICGSYLAETATRLRRLFPDVEMRPIVADFAEDFTLPAAVTRRGNRTAFFPGSTIGNLAGPQSGALLRRMRAHTGPFGSAIIGVDLKKDVDTLLRAYDDSRGVTAAFNLNLLERMNRELGADFDVDEFIHEARWNDVESAIEMHLVSRVDQDVAIGRRLFTFRAGESLHTESSRKYDAAGFIGLAEAHGWRVVRTWQDAERTFAIFGLAAT